MTPAATTQTRARPPTTPATISVVFEVAEAAEAALPAPVADDPAPEPAPPRSETNDPPPGLPVEKPDIPELSSNELPAPVVSPDSSSVSPVSPRLTSIRLEPPKTIVSPS